MRLSFNVFISTVTAVLMLLGCATIRPVPVQTTTQVQTVVRDSVRWKDSTIYVQVPIERYVDVVPVYDTLRLETELAQAEAYVDTLTRTLKGNIENRKEPFKTIIKYQDRKVEIRKDSIITKEIPIEVETIKKVVPKWVFLLIAANILMVIMFGVRMYVKYWRTSI